MFGFLSAARWRPRYRQYYAVCCQNHFENYGRLSTVFHSYEAVFLYSLAAESGIVLRPSESVATCCKLTRRINDNPLVGTEHGKFLAAFAMLLGGIKLKDDIQDDKSWAASIGHWFLKKPIRHSSEYFQTLDSEFSVRLAEILDTHIELEQKRPDEVDLNQFQKATSEGFGYLFGLFAETFIDSREQQEVIREIGSCLGAAIIAFDCAIDWERDRRTGAFNPLQSREAANQAFFECKSKLAEICWQLRKLGHAEGVSISIIRDTFKGLERWKVKAPDSGSSVINSQVSKPRGIQRRRIALRRGDCDCCCPLDACSGGCECGGACSSCGDAGGGECCQVAAGGPSCAPGCDVCCFACDCCHSTDSRTQRKGQRDSRRDARVGAGNEELGFVGQIGQTVDPLNPSGVVRIGEEEFPAVSQDGAWIEAATAVIIVGHDNLGLKVRKS